VSTPEKEDFHLDLTFTGREYSKAIQITTYILVSLIIVFILATMTTNVAAYILPMSDEYLQVLVPQAPDGKEPLALKALDQTTTDNTLTVTGTVLNRTDFPVSGLLAVLNALDVKYNKQTAKVPLTPAEIPSQQTGSFQVTVTLPDQPGQYSLEFRIPDGPAVPHRDDRAANLNITVPEPPKK